MITLVLISNGLIGIACLLVAWQLWQLKATLAAVADALLSVERAVYDVLHPAPGYILKGQAGMHQLRQNYQKLEPQFERLERALALMGVGQMLWKRRSILIKRPKSTRRTSKRSR